MHKIKMMSNLVSGQPSTTTEREILCVCEGLWARRLDHMLHHPMQIDVMSLVHIPM